MAMDVQNWGAVIPTTVTLDVAEINQIEVTSPEFKELLVRLYRNVNDIQALINLKDTGFYFTTQFVTSQLFFNVNNDLNNLRPISRIVVNFGALPNNTTKSVAHGIVGLGTTWSLVKFYATATNQNTKAVPVPGFDPADITKPINMWFDPTNVTIQTTSDMTAYTTIWVIIEYILN